jgi:hypothetical protein
MPRDSLEYGGQLFFEVTVDQVCHNRNETGDEILKANKYMDLFLSTTVSLMI